MCLIKNPHTVERVTPYPSAVKCGKSGKTGSEAPKPGTGYRSSNNVFEPQMDVLAPMERSRCNTWSSQGDTPRGVDDDSSIYDDLNLAPRNPWGDSSYGDLIGMAIRSVPERRMLLSQIYDWLIENVPYFGERADKESSTGWKNSVRHNLSLHKKFLRVNNEVPGMPSWWVINPAKKRGQRGQFIKGPSQKPSNNPEPGTEVRLPEPNPKLDAEVEAQRKVAEIKASLKMQQASVGKQEGTAGVGGAPTSYATTYPTQQGYQQPSNEPGCQQDTIINGFLNSSDKDDEELTATLQSLFPDEFQDYSGSGVSSSSMEALWSLSPSIPGHSDEDFGNMSPAVTSNSTSSYSSMDTTNNSSVSSNNSSPKNSVDLYSLTPVQMQQRQPQYQNQTLSTQGNPSSSASGGDYIELVHSVPQNANQINYDTYLKLMKTLNRPVVLCDMCHSVVCHSAAIGGHTMHRH